MKPCERCGDRINTSEWYPVAAPEDRDRILSFCSQHCLDEWTATNRAAEEDDRNRPTADGGRRSTSDG